MGLGYLGSDMQAETQALKAGPDLSPEKRLKEIGHRGFRDRLAGVGDRKLEHAVAVRATNLTGLSGAPCVSAFPSRFETSWPMRTVAVDRSCNPKSFRYPVRHGRPQFVHDLCNTGSSGLLGIPAQGNSTAQSTTREVQNVIDQAGHACDGRFHHLQYTGFGFVPWPTKQYPGARADRSERVSQIMAEHGDKLFPQLRSLAFILQIALAAASDERL